VGDLRSQSRRGDTPAPSRDRAILRAAAQTVRSTPWVLQNKRAIPIIQLLLILPAALFMIALVFRVLGPLQYEPAHAAQAIVMWYSRRIWTLWVLLIALPLAVLGVGCAMLLSQWTDGARLRTSVALIRADRTTLFSTVLTLAAAVILVIVAVHMMMN
jgi:hypothetical protein